MSTLFTRIIRGEIPAQIVFRDEHFVAFLDISPAAPGHCLLVPVAEVQYFADLSTDHAARFGPALQRLIRAVKSATACPAVNVLINDGPEANQAIPHAHVHIIPRQDGDGRLTHPKGTPYNGDGLATMAARIRAHV